MSIYDSSSLLKLRRDSTKSGPQVCFRGILPGTTLNKLPTVVLCGLPSISNPDYSGLDPALSDLLQSEPLEPGHFPEVLGQNRQVRRHQSIIN